MVVGKTVCLWFGSVKCGSEGDGVTAPFQKEKLGAGNLFCSREWVVPLI